MKTVLETNINKRIVLDTKSSWVYIGKLEKVGNEYVVLSDADVHDSHDSETSKDRYLFESRDTGIKINRDKVYVNIAYIVSFSLFDDIRHF